MKRGSILEVLPLLQQSGEAYPGCKYPRIREAAHQLIAEHVLVTLLSQKSGDGRFEGSSRESFWFG